MTIAEEFRRVLTRETTATRLEVETVTFDVLARMVAGLGEQRVRELGWWVVIEPYMPVVA